MTLYELTFSVKLSRRLARHSLFWLVYFITFFYSGMDVESIGDFRHAPVYEVALVRIACFLPASIFAVYLSLYLLVPHLVLKKKYMASLAMLIAIALLVYYIDVFNSKYFLYVLSPDLKPGATGHRDLSKWQHIYAYYGGIQNTMPVCFCAIVIKLAKATYLRQAENTRLAYQKKEYELRLVKNNMQPIFFSRSSRSLYKICVSSPNNAPGMVLQLSDLFSYILYDRGDAQLELEKEITAVQNLLFLEETMSEGLTSIQMSVSGNSAGKFIIPSALFSIFSIVIDSALLVSAEVQLQIYDELLLLSLMFTTPDPDSVAAVRKELERRHIYFVNGVNEAEHSSSFTMRIPLQTAELKNNLAIHPVNFFA